jgi:hypothetical protein
MGQKRSKIINVEYTFISGDKNWELCRIPHDHGILLPFHHVRLANPVAAHRSLWQGAVDGTKCGVFDTVYVTKTHAKM